MDIKLVVTVTVDDAGLEKLNRKRQALGRQVWSAEAEAEHAVVGALDHGIYSGVKVALVAEDILAALKAQAVCAHFENNLLGEDGLLTCQDCLLKFYPGKWREAAADALIAAVRALPPTPESKG